MKFTQLYTSVNKNISATEAGAGRWEIRECRVYLKSIQMQDTETRNVNDTTGETDFNTDWNTQD